MSRAEWSAGPATQHCTRKRTTRRLDSALSLQRQAREQTAAHNDQRRHTHNDISTSEFIGHIVSAEQRMPATLLVVAQRAIKYQRGVVFKQR